MENPDIPDRYAHPEEQRTESRQLTAGEGDRRLREPKSAFNADGMGMVTDK